MSTRPPESLWEAVNYVRDNYARDKDIFDQGFTLTQHGREEHSFFVLETAAWDYAWVLRCDLSTGCWEVS